MQSDELAEDIADDSEEEKSIKEVNMFQIRALETGAVGKKSFAKHFSEHDFLQNDRLRVSSSLDPTEKAGLVRFQQDPAHCKNKAFPDIRANQRMPKSS